MAFGDPGTGGPLETELRNIPATWLDRPANWLEKVRQVAEAAQTAAGPRTEILPAILKLLIGNKPEMLRDVSGGFPVTEGSGETLHVKPQYAGDVMDFALASAGVPKVAKALVNAGMSGPLGKAAQEGVLRFGGDPSFMYSHGISGGLDTPYGEGLLKELLHPSLAITGKSSHYNPFGQQHGVLIPLPGAHDPAYAPSSVLNRDAYIARTNEYPGGKSPTAAQRVTSMGLLPPPRSEGVQYNNWTKGIGDTGFLRADSDFMARADNAHNAAIFSSPLFRSLREFELSPRGGGTLGAERSDVQSWSGDISHDFQEWFNTKNRGDSYGADWLETLREYAKDGDKEAQSLLERFKRAPSDYGEIKVSGRVPLTAERWAGAILKPHAYNQWAEGLAGRGIPSILEPNISGGQRWKQIHEIATAMQEMAGPVKERPMRVAAGWDPKQVRDFKIEAPPGETPVSQFPPSEWQGMAKKPPAGLTQEQADIHAAAINATEDPDYDGYTAIFTHKGQAYHMDAESGAIINSDTHHIVGNIDNPKGISLSEVPIKKGAASFDSKEDAMKAAQKSMIKQEAQNANDKDLLDFISMLDSHGVPPGLLEKAAAVHTPSLKGSTKFDNHGKEYFVNQTGDVLYKGYPVGNVKDATKAAQGLDPSMHEVDDTFNQFAKNEITFDLKNHMAETTHKGFLHKFKSGTKNYHFDSDTGTVTEDTWGAEPLFTVPELAKFKGDALKNFGGGAPADLAWQKMKAAQGAILGNDLHAKAVAAIKDNPHATSIFENNGQQYKVMPGTGSVYKVDSLGFTVGDPVHNVGAAKAKESHTTAIEGFAQQAAANGWTEGTKGLSTKFFHSPQGKAVALNPEGKFEAIVPSDFNKEGTYKQFDTFAQAAEALGEPLPKAAPEGAGLKSLYAEYEQLAQKFAKGFHNGDSTLTDVEKQKLEDLGNLFGKGGQGTPQLIPPEILTPQFKDSVIAKAKKLQSLGSFGPEEPPALFWHGTHQFQLLPDGTIEAQIGDSNKWQHYATSPPKAAQAPAKMLSVPADDIMKQYDMGLLPPGQAYKMLAEKFAKNLHNGPPLAADEMAQLEWFQKHLGDVPQ